MVETNDLECTGDEKEDLIVGPPGCGKTSWLSKRVKEEYEKGHEVMVQAMTRAAAVEVSGRDLPIQRTQVGTLHSHCFHSLSEPKIAEDKECLKDWNQSYPHFALTLGGPNRIDEDNLEPPNGTEGDRMMNQYQIHRAKMEQDIPDEIIPFVHAWNDWKKANGLMDFTELVETCLRDVDTAPGNPDVIFTDEGQDLTRLEIALTRKWGMRAGYMVTVGDPDQCIYKWRGADPLAFMEPIAPHSQRRILAQSFRVPRAVHAHAVEWVNQIKGRLPVDYHPRDAKGEVRRLETAAYKYPEAALKDAEKYLAQDDKTTVMFLATCSYMLQPLIAVLRKNGIPFHNPWRASNGAWNPLQRRRNQITAGDRVLAFLNMSRESNGWTAEDLRKWTKTLASKGVLAPKSRGAIKEITDDDPLGYGIGWDTLHHILSDEAIDAGLQGDLDWYRRHLLASMERTAQFPITIAKLQGPEKLEESPRVVVGTIHSAKGSEADVVYLFPDLSSAGASEWTGTPEQKSAVYRLFYVGMTRAKHSLILYRRSAGMAVNC